MTGINNKKNVLKFLIVIAIVLVLGFLAVLAVPKLYEKICEIPSVKELLSIYSDNGIVLMDEEGNRIKTTSVDPAYLVITEDNVTISGTAQNDVMIVLEGNAANITLDNFDKDIWDVEIYMSETNDGSLTFKGENYLIEIFADTRLKLQADSLEDKLAVSKCISAEGIDIYGGTISTGYIKSYKDIDISGEAAIKLVPMRNFALEKFSYARLEAYEDLNIDLKGNGVVEAYGSRQYNVPASAVYSFNIGEGTALTIPEDGVLGISDAGYGEEYMFIDTEGNPIDHILLESKPQRVD